MERDKTMAETVAPHMPTAAEIAACKWLTEAELAVYSAEYARTGFQGGLNWYRVRTSGRFDAELQVFAGRTIDVPSAFISGKSDWGVYQAPGALEAMQTRACTRMLACQLVEGAGHWVQQEQPDAVSPAAHRVPARPRAQCADVIAFAPLAPALHKMRVADSLPSSAQYGDDAALEPARNILRTTFGHAEFRGLQAGVIGEILAGRNALAVLPTGGGKSLCYQIPALIRPGLGLVVSPLIALMADQVAALQQSGVAAEKLELRARARRHAATSGGASAKARWTCSTCRRRA